MKPELPPLPKSYYRAHRVLGPGMHKLHLSCSHFADLSLQSMDRPLTLVEKIRYRIHFILCSVCRNFEKQMRSLSALVRSSFAGQKPETPTPEFLSSVREKLESIATHTDAPEDPNR
jgi:hypothetical protein